MSTSHSRGLFRRCPKSGRIVGYNFRSWWVCALFPIIGFLALIWFLIRVSAKPSRASYPCQQASLALGTGFLLWLMGTLGILALSRWIGALVRPRRRAAILVGLASLGILSLWSLLGLPHPLASAWTPTDPPNTPVGAAKGIFPGRVVWARDAAATPWNGSTGHWWDDTTGTNQSAVDSMLSSSLRSLSGAATDAAAWDALLRHYNNTHGRGNVGYQSGERIAIKINCNNTSNYTDTDNQADASPHTVLGILRQLVNQAGIPQNMITVYEAPETPPSRVIPDRIYNKGHGEFPNVVWADCAGTGTNGRADIAWTTNAITYSVSNGCGRNVPTCVTQATYLINMALLKGHNTAGVTLTAKNHYGSINGREHTFIRSSSSGMGAYSPFVDLIGHKDLGGKAVLFMIDALYGAQDVGNNPGRWPVLFNNEWSSSFLLSQDPVAIDSVGVDLLITEFSNLSPNNGWMPNCDNYLHEAAQANSPPSGTFYAPHGDGVRLASLGVHEHWNHASDRQYSRNLGTGNGIELVKLQGGGTVSVSITSPAANATYSPPATINITANASDTGGTITKVDFYQNGNLIGTDTSSAGGWTYSWSGVGTGSYALTARATSSTGQTAPSAPVAVFVLRNPENPAGAVNGLDYAYYHGTWNSLPDFGALTPVKTGTVANFDLTPRTQNDNFGFRFTGYVNAASDGVYTFYTTSDDGSRLWIGSTLAVDNDGLHGMVEASGRIGLKAGRHALTVTMFENAGGEGLEVRYEGPSLAKQIIPDGALYRVPPVVLPTATVTASDANASEPGTDTGAFTVSRTGSTSAALTVNFTIGGSAVNGTDYSSIGTSVTIGAGSAFATVTVTPLDDTAVEGNEMVILTLSTNAAYTVGTPSSATVTIADNDSAPPSGNGTGLAAEYFDNADLTNRAVARIDAVVNFDWAAGSPDALIGADTFSARWFGSVQPRYSETYTFYTTTDDGVRLWVNGQLLVDKWVNQGPTEWSGTAALAAGTRYEIRMEYYENGGGAAARLSWSSPTQAKEAVPQSQLYPWADRDIGAAGVAGSASWTGASFTVDGSGADLWGAADAFRFVYRALTGDGEIRARVASVENTNAWAKAGVMMRETLDANSRHAMAVLTPGNGLAFQRRATTGGSSAHTSGGAAAAPTWVRLVRQGNSFSAYRSADGSSWTWIGTETIAMNATIYVGLAVTSHDNAALCTAQIDGVAVTAGSPPANALVTIMGVSTNRPYSLGTAELNALPCIDRSYRITAISAGLDGGVLVRTAMDDKYVAAADHLTLALGQSSVVYVCYDKRGTLPSWLNDGTWTLTSESISSTDGAASPLRVYAKTVPAGTLTLGGNHAGGDTGARANYFVVIQPAVPAARVFVEGPIPPDAWKHEADLDGDGTAEAADGDGDGLWNAFEPGQGVDPGAVDTDGDGVPDEGVLAPDGRTLWEVQEGIPAGGAVPAGDGGGGHRCGGLGLEFLLPLGLLRLLRRRKDKRNARRGDSGRASG